MPFGRKMNEMAESFLKPYRDHERMMRSMLEPYERTRKMFEDPIGIRMLRQQMTIGSEFEKVLAPYRQQQSTIDQMLRSFQPRTSVFEELMTAVLQPAATLTFLADAEKILKNFRIEHVTTTGVTINGEEISFVEAEDELNEVWSTTASLPPQERVDATNRTFARSKQPPLLLILLAYILGAMFESPIQTITDPVLVPRAKQVLKWLEVNVPSVWATAATPEIWSVTRDSLELRLLPKRSSTKHHS